MPPEAPVRTGMVDLHCHVLPGIDDGAADLDEAVVMCRHALRDGCTALVATPHTRHPRWRNDDHRLLERLCGELRDALPEGPEIHLGGEIAVHTESVDEIFARRPEDPGALGLAGSRYLLLELDWRGLGPDPVELVHELAVAGWLPVIAHPERVSWLARNPPLLAALVSHGALLQVTAQSLTGDLGRMAQNCAAALLDNNLVHFVASDAHDPRIRPTGLQAAYLAVCRARDETVAERIFFAHPRAVMENRPVAGEPAGKPAPRERPVAHPAPTA